MSDKEKKASDVIDYIKSLDESVLSEVRKRIFKKDGKIDLLSSMRVVDSLLDKMTDNPREQLHILMNLFLNIFDSHVVKEQKGLALQEIMNKYLEDENINYRFVQLN